VDLPIHVIVGVTGAAGLDDETTGSSKAAGGWNSPPRESDYLGFGRPSRTIGSESQRRKTTRLRLTELSFKRLVAAGVKQIFASGAYTVGHGVQAYQFAIYVKWGMSRRKLADGNERCR